MKCFHLIYVCVHFLKLPTQTMQLEVYLCPMQDLRAAARAHRGRKRPRRNLVVLESYQESCQSLTSARGLQWDIVYLMADHIAPSYIWAQMRGGGVVGLGLSQWVQLYTGAQTNFGDLTPYLTYDISWWTQREGEVRCRDRAVVQYMGHRWCS